MNEQENRRANALLKVGQLHGMASTLDVDALEEVLKNPQPDFRYAAEVRAAIKFAKSLRGRKR